MVLNVFKNVGDRLTIAQAYTALINLNSNDPYKKEKAAGCLGGAVNGGTLIRNEGYYIRIR